MPLEIYSIEKTFNLLSDFSFFSNIIIINLLSSEFLHIVFKSRNECLSKKQDKNITE